MAESELVPGIKFEPLGIDMEKFREEWREEMTPALDDQRIRRAKSELDSMSHWVD